MAAFSSGLITNYPKYNKPFFTDGQYRRIFVTETAIPAKGLGLRKAFIDTGEIRVV